MICDHSLTHSLQFSFSQKYFGCFDFIYCFDVFPHCDIHTIYNYLVEIRKLLKKDGRAFLSTANLLSEDGWKRFSRQSKFTVGGFYFLTPEIVLKLVMEAGLRLVRRSDAREDTGGNTYYDRDFLFVVERDDMPQEKNTPAKPSTFFR